MTVTAVRLGGRPGLPLLVLGPSLGTSATTLWSAAAERLARDFQVVAWDLPGHGTNRAPVEGPVTVAGLAADVLDLVDSLVDDLTPRPFHYAGDSVGGAVGLQLLLDAPQRVSSATLLCTGARIGEREGWLERVETVRASGTPALVPASAERWFGPGFLDREPDRGSALLHALRDADDAGYVAVCGALAEFDVRDRLAEIKTPVLAVAGSADAVARSTWASPSTSRRTAMPASRTWETVIASRSGPPRTCSPISRATTSGASAGARWPTPSSTTSRPSATPVAMASSPDGGVTASADPATASTAASTSPSRSRRSDAARAAQTCV